MKMATAWKLHQPVWGARSPTYIGIGKWFELTADGNGFFRSTSHMATGEKTPDPRFKVMPLTVHKECRQLLIEAGAKHEFTGEEVEREWEVLIRQATEQATKQVITTESGLRDHPVLYSKANQKAVKKALEDAMDHVFLAVRKRLSSLSSWTNKPAYDLGLADDVFDNVYFCYDPNRKCETEGSKVFKIGRALDVKKRFDSHLTSNPDLELIYHYPACRELNELTVHNLFAEYRQNKNREFFELPPEAQQVIQSRVRLLAAIRENKEN